MAAGVQGESVARNYAEALLTLGRKAGDARGWGDLIRQVADAIDADVTLRTFLGTPRIPSERKAAVLSAALGPRVPTLFLRFLLQLVRNRRQLLIGAIASEFATLLDASEGMRGVLRKVRSVPSASMASATCRIRAPHPAASPALRPSASSASA